MRKSSYVEDEGHWGGEEGLENCIGQFRALVQGIQPPFSHVSLVRCGHMTLNHMAQGR